jgi:hypothetical protein
MSAFELSKTRLFEGVWEGLLTAIDENGTKPDLGVTHLEKPLGELLLKETGEPNQWAVRIPNSGGPDR